jgi:hydroxymethylglutaryl-CoA reductase (NADPH)
MTEVIDAEAPPVTSRIPRSGGDDYTPEMAQARRAFIAEHAAVKLHHTAQFSFDPKVLPGNIENFFGVVQVPIGVAGPLRVDGEHAQGDFYVPLATTEGSLVASYNRGMRLLRESGGVRTTVVEQLMQRSPVFIFADAREARAFGEWIDANFASIKAAAESTTRWGKLVKIGQYSAGCMRYLRLNFTTGDAAGQNMAGKATLAACEWIKQNYGKRFSYILSGNIDTDKKHSHMNVLHTRGMRVVAEAVIPAALLKSLMRVDTREMFRARQLTNVGALLSGASNNGAHAANGITAMFIATGQDVANVSESHTAIAYTQLLDNGDYYWSITLPALIVATYGGGTSLPTQRECLEMLGCYGAGKSKKLAEIIAATVLAGETSLSGAIMASEWVTSHDRYGRNRK